MFSFSILHYLQFGKWQPYVVSSSDNKICLHPYRAKTEEWSHFRFCGDCIILWTCVAVTLRVAITVVMQYVHNYGRGLDIVIIGCTRSESLQAWCYNLEMVVQWISVYLNFPPLHLLAQCSTVIIMLSAQLEKGQMHPASHQSARARTPWCCCSYSRVSRVPTEVSIAVIANRQG